MPPFAGAVLTGGQSRRLGSVKPLAVWGDRPLVDYAVSALRTAGAQAVMAVGWPDEPTRRALEALQLIVVADQVAGAGPAAGIVAALDAASTGCVAVLACDTPLVDAGTVRALVDACGGGAGRVDGAVAVVDGARQPLIAAYRHSARPAFASAAEAGWALRRALDSLTVAEITIGAAAATNINTPEDLELFRRRSTWPEGGGR